MASLLSAAGATYIYMTLPVVSGAAGCHLFRTIGASTTYVGPFVCGSVAYDFGVTTANAPVITASNNTGGILSPGFMNAQAFFAKGSGAGTDVLMTGAPLSACSSTNAQPCISTMNQIFVQAPNASIPSWGITLPNPAPPTSGNTPLLLGPLTTTGSLPPTSAAIVGSLSNSSATELATVPTGATFTSGDLASWDVSGNVTDSTISAFSISAAGGPGIFLPTIANPLNTAAAAQLTGTNSVRFIQFVNPIKIAVGHITVNVTASGTSNFDVGVYSLAGNLLFHTGAVACASGFISTAITSYTLQPGAYYMAYVGGDATCSINGLPSSSTNSGMMNKNNTKMGTFPGSGAGSPLPSTVGTVTGGGINVIFAYVEP